MMERSPGEVMSNQSNYLDFVKLEFVDSLISLLVNWFKAQGAGPKKISTTEAQTSPPASPVSAWVGDGGRGSN